MVAQRVSAGVWVVLQLQPPLLLEAAPGASQAIGLPDSVVSQLSWRPPIGIAVQVSSRFPGG